MEHERFDWDVGKAKSNLRKHGVSFVDAARALADQFHEIFHVDDFDAAHSETEDRWITIASDPQDRAAVLITVWTERYDDQGALTWIISSRLVTATERRAYEDQIRQQRRPDMGQ